MKNVVSTKKPSPPGTGTRQPSPLAASGEADAVRVGDLAQSGEAQSLGLLRLAWRGWLRFAEILGTVQMIVILSLLYWTMLAIVAIPMRLMGDPMRLRRRHPPEWVPHDSDSISLESMAKQS